MYRIIRLLGQVIILVCVVNYLNFIKAKDLGLTPTYILMSTD
jgi:hypothetical protein